jgi:hypothetical protein
MQVLAPLIRSPVRANPSADMSLWHPYHTHTYHVQSFDPWIMVSDQCCSPFTVKSRTSTSASRYHHLFLCLAIGVRCPSRDTRCTSSSHLPLVAPSKRFADRSSRYVQNAIDIAKESFRELKDVERGRIHFEVKVDLGKMQQTGTAEIGRGAWPLVVPSLARFEIVEIRVAPMGTHGQAGVALSSSQASAVEPPAYSPENSEYSYEQQIPSSRSSSPPSLVTRIVNFFTCRSRPSP